VLAPRCTPQPIVTKLSDTLVRLASAPAELDKGRRLVALTTKS